MGKRVVVIEKDGRSTFHPDTGEPRLVAFEHTPGFAISTIWATEPGAPPPRVGEDPALALESYHPRPGGTVFMTMTVPPDEVYLAEGFDPVRAGAEAAAHSPGIAERMEADAPGFHRTDTIDYVIVLDGEIVAECDDGEATLRAGDILVQNATRHAWHNRSGAAATIAIVLVGARV